MSLPQRPSPGLPPDGPAEIDYGPVGERLGYWLRRAQVAVFEDFFERFRAHDIRPAQYSALTIIERNPGLSQTAVGDALGIQKANFVVMIGELERRGLACRKPDKRDKRSYCLFLTPKGEKLMVELHQLSEDHERGVRKCVGEKAYQSMSLGLRDLAGLSENIGWKDGQLDVGTK